MIASRFTNESVQLATDSFQAWKMQESTPGDSGLDTDISDALVDHLMGTDYLQRASELLGWPVLESIKNDRLPTKARVKRGVYGEVLASEVLTSFHGLQVPVKKLRYRMALNESTHATDVLAITVDNSGKLTSLHYVECKLRTTRSDMASLASIAHDQLKKDVMERAPWIVHFITQVLNDRMDPLWDSFMLYLSSRSQLRIDRHHIFLVVDHSCWRDSDLACVSDIDPKLSPLEIHTITIQDLRPRVDEAFSLAHVEVIPIDE